MKNQLEKTQETRIILVALALTLVFVLLSMITYGQTAEEKIASFEQKIINVETDISTLKSQIDEVSDKKERKQIEKQIAEKEKQIADYKKEIAELKENKFLDEDIAVTEDTTEIRVGEKRVIIIGKRGKLEESIEKLKDGIVEFNIKIEKHNKNIDNYEDSLKIAENKLAETTDKAEKEKLEKKIEQYEAQIEMNEEIVESFDDGIEDIEDELSELEDELDELAEELSNDFEDFDFGFGKKKRKRKFKGHWAGFEFASANYLNNNYQLALPADGEFMELNSEKSWQFSFNFFQQSIPFNRYMGLVTGAGVEWTYYSLKNNIDLAAPNGIIAPVEVFDKTYERNMFRTTYFNVPLLMEFHIPVNKKDKRINIGLGAIGGVKLASNFKKVYYVDGDKIKNKVRGDYQVSPYRYQLTTRIGYEKLQLQLNYNMVSLFEPNKGPELYPFSIGVGFRL